MFDWLVVGAGFAGSVIARQLATQRDEFALVIDRRPHIGGNAYDRYDRAGILIHQYGPHIFHTNSQAIFALSPSSPTGAPMSIAAGPCRWPATADFDQPGYGEPALWAKSQLRRA